jgi:hypothetical protein
MRIITHFPIMRSILIHSRRHRSRHRPQLRSLRPSSRPRQPRPLSWFVLAP